MSYSIKRFSSEPSLEDYEEFDDKRLKSLTDNQKKMILEDERLKARRNRGKIVSHHAKIEGEIGKEKGKKSGTKWGAGIGTAAGALIGGHTAKSKVAGALLGAAGGALAGGVLGRLSGASSGEAKGRRKGAVKGARIAEEGGHNEHGIMTRHARAFDDYERKSKKGNDHWETDVRKQIKDEKEAAAKEAARRRAEELERRRVAAEEMRARAEQRSSYARMEDARTNRTRLKKEYE